MRILLLGLFGALLCACAEMPSEDQAKAADYGSKPENYQEIVKNYYKFSLSDPDSALYDTISEPRRYWLASKLEGAKYGYLVCATLNSKNMFGAYSGYETNALLIHNGEVIEHISGGSWGGQNICPKAE